MIAVSTVESSLSLARSPVACRGSGSRSLCSRSLRAIVLRARIEEAEGGQRAFDGVAARQETSLDADRVRAEAKPTAAMLHGEPLAVESAMRPFFGLRQSSK